MRCACILAVVLAVAASSLPADEAAEVTYRGKVVDEKGQPIAGAKVAGYALAGGWVTRIVLKEIGTSTTGTDGAFAFTLKDPVAETVIVTARKEGLASNWVNWEDDKALDETTIVLGKPETLAGIVVDNAGRSVTGATVRPYLVSGPEEDPQYVIGLEPVNWLIAKTDTGGRFGFPDMPAGVQAVFFVEAPGKARLFPISMRSSLPYTAGQKDIELVVEDEGRIEGVLVQKDGTPVADISVSASGWGSMFDDMFGGRSSKTDKDGRFVLGGLDAGGYTIRIVSEKGPPDFVTSEKMIEVANGKTTSAVKVEVEKGGLLRVVVTDGKGKPVPNAAVTVGDRTGKLVVGWFEHSIVDERGIALFHLRPGQHRISVWARGFCRYQSPEPIEVEGNKTKETRVPLEALAKITGVVRDTEGKPVEGAVVQASDTDSLVPTSRGRVRTGANGQFTVSLEMNQSITLVIRHAPRGLVSVTEVTDGAKPVEIVLRTGTVLKGLVADEDGKPIEGAKVTATDRDFGSFRVKADATTDKQGRYEIKGIPSGEYRLSARADGFSAASGIAKAKQGLAEVEIEKITLSPVASSIAGQVRGSDGKPAARADVYAYCKINGSSGRAQTDKDGKFRIEMPAEGKVSIYILGPSGQRSEAKATAGDKDVQIILRDKDSDPGTRPATSPATRKSEDS